jgi:hypothetical protein
MKAEKRMLVVMVVVFIGVMVMLQVIGKEMEWAVDGMFLTFPTEYQELKPWWMSGALVVAGLKIVGIVIGLLMCIGQLVKIKEFGDNEDTKNKYR